MGLDNGDGTFLGEHAYRMVAFRFSYVCLWFSLKTVLTYSFYKLRWNYNGIITDNRIVECANKERSSSAMRHMEGQCSKFRVAFCHFGVGL
jgi:hypothetical protein